MIAATHDFLMCSHYVGEAVGFRAVVVGEGAIHEWVAYRWNEVLCDWSLVVLCNLSGLTTMTP